jgi:hypothetical protein
MRKVIFFDLKGGVNPIELHAGAQITRLTLKKFATKGFDRDYIIRKTEAVALVGWAVVDDSKPIEKRVLIATGTNMPVPPAAVFIDSIMFEDEKLAIHLFEVKA